MWNKLSVEAFERAFSGAVTFLLVGIFPSGVFTTKAQALEAIIYDCSFFWSGLLWVFSPSMKPPLNQVLIQILDKILLHKSISDSAQRSNISKKFNLIQLSIKLYCPFCSAPKTTPFFSLSLSWIRKPSHFICCDQIFPIWETSSVLKIGIQGPWC